MNTSHEDITKILLTFGAPNESILTTHQTLSILPYFKNLPKTVTSLFVDRDKEATMHVLETIRNPKNKYTAPDWVVEEDFKYFNEERGDESVEENYITINVGGTLFQTTTQTLLKTPSILQAHLSRWMANGEKEIFIDRDPTAFRHILSLLRNPRYPYYDATELAFYCIAIPTSPSPPPSEETVVKLPPKVDDTGISGGNMLLALVATGHLDTILHYNPTYTLYGGSNLLKPPKLKVGSRSANTARSLIHIRPNNGPTRLGRCMAFHLSRLGDLIDHLFLYIHIPGEIKLADIKYPDSKQFIFSMIRRISLQIGGTTVGEYSTDSLYMYANKSIIKSPYLVLPLNFLTHYLNLISIVYNEINILLEFNPAHMIFHNDFSPEIDCEIIGNYVLLDGDERRCLTRDQYQHLNYTLTPNHHAAIFSDYKLTTHLPDRTTQIIFAIKDKDSDNELFNYQSDVLIGGVIKLGDNILCHINPLTLLLHKYTTDTSDTMDSPMYYLSLLDQKTYLQTHSQFVSLMGSQPLTISLNFTIPSGVVHFYCGQSNHTLCRGGIFNLKYA